MTRRGPAIEERLVARARSLIDVPSVSRDEAALLAVVRESLPAGFDVLDDDDGVLFAAARPDQGRPFVVLAGHVDTVPIANNVPSTMEDGAIVGRGAADMKGALAVMLELAHRAPEPPEARSMSASSSSAVRSCRSATAPCCRCSIDARPRALPTSRS